MSEQTRDSSAPSGEAHDGPGPELIARLPANRLTVGEDELSVDGADLAAVKDVLALLGASGLHRFDHLDVSQSISLLQHVRELTGALAAVQASALVHLEEAVKEDCRRRGETLKQAAQIARAEASMALKKSKASAGQSMSSSRRLVRSMPGMLTALAQGRVTPASAHAVGRTMGPADPAQRRLVDTILTEALPYLEGSGTREWAGEAEKVLHGLDPEGAARRHQEAKRDRSVTVHRGEHGMCTVTARLTGIDGARIRKGLSLAAERARAGGDRRGHQQIMADMFADALLGRSDGLDPGTFEIGLVITDRSLFASGHEDAATVEGYGPVPFEHAREQMLDTIQRSQDDPELAMMFRQIHIDAEDGQAMSLQSVARRFPASAARFLRTSHQSCRGPYCDAHIRQMDHIQPVAEGGPTSLENGNGLCAGDNLKELAGQTARVIKDEGGMRRTVKWTSRYGQSASRGAVNLDPLGTAARTMHEKSEKLQIQRELRRRKIARLMKRRRAQQAIEAEEKRKRHTASERALEPSSTLGGSLSPDASPALEQDLSPAPTLEPTPKSELTPLESGLHLAIALHDRHAARRRPRQRPTSWVLAPGNRRTARAGRRDFILRPLPMLAMDDAS